MNTHYRKMKNLFLCQSYLDSWEDYIRSISKDNFILWDYLIITASNEEQAENYREQIQYRLDRGLLPAQTHYAVLPDPEGKRVGSGGATFNVLKYIREQEGDKENPFCDRRILVIHSGGDSKRVPQYSASGKLFSPVPRELPNGNASTLFDEFVIGMSGVPSRIREGMLILSGDVLLLFNPLQIDSQFHGAAAISMKETVEVGKDHGVFLNDGQDCVKSFLHKQTEETLKEIGAVNEQGYVDLDTGAVLFDTDLLKALLDLISEGIQISPERFKEFVNEKARISFYGDFLYPLASAATLEQYYLEKPEGNFTEELRNCRTRIWEAIHNFSMKLICLSPAEFIHFGTTAELVKLVTEDVDNYEFLNWRKNVCSTSDGQTHASHNAYIGKRAVIEAGCYIENSFVLGKSRIGAGSVISGMYLRDEEIPKDIVLHGLELKDDRYVVRIYGVYDNPKDTFCAGNQYIGHDMQVLCAHLTDELREGTTLWDAPLYPVCDSLKDALDMALLLYRIARGQASKEEIDRWKTCERLSLNSSFNRADSRKLFAWKQDLENRILASRFIAELEKGTYYREARKIFGKSGLTEPVFRNLLNDAQKTNTAMKIRIYYAISRIMKDERKSFGGDRYGVYEALCFKTIEKEIADHTLSIIQGNAEYKMCRNEINVSLPVRVNWGGGWSDTPPYCIENGGNVLNAAVKLNGILPVQVTARRLDHMQVEFASEDVGAYGTIHSMEEIRDCHNPYDPFALHKAALLACGIIPLTGEEALEDWLKRMGGGIYLSTQVIGVPKGSGLGTSSILSGACVKALFDLFNIDRSFQELFLVVSCMEQIMSTGGGWQDQVGGLTSGVKLISTKPGIEQKIRLTQVSLTEQTKQKLQERFALIYTGQRRLARNLLRDVVGHYIGGKPEAVQALKDIQEITVLMKYQLERGDIDAFAQLLNRHWELSKILDQGTTNTCIEQIFMACEDLIDGRFVAGAGGGGFLQVILKRGVTKQTLRERLRAVFQDSGVDVWESEILW